ncbi:LacI family DNA-binding transcriptional regulator [Nocardia carnea]|uniref:LacI family DNA-binding transcriptional regulator n=1 Tax=Nocardia carnea TaxID=37328 RepID=UPI0024575D81|nr:LacI family DNA-binding transcriptional regulator [Nocardia carnea]
MRPPTIYDVAAAAGVSPSTVSRAFSRPGRVSAETASRIHRIAADLGYRANALTGVSARERTSAVAMVVPDVTNPVYFGLIHGFEAAATSAGYTVVLADTRWSMRQERTVLDRILPAVDGLVVTGSRLSDRGMRAAAGHRALVMLNRIVPGTRTVLVDTAAGVDAALRHLAGLGHRSVTYVGGPQASWAEGMRWRSLLDAAPRFGLKVCRVGPYPPTMAGGTAAVDELRRDLPSAVLVFNDLVAIGILHGVKEAGIRVPDEMSVIGFGNVVGADFCTPPLTTVGTPMRAMGTTAFEQLQRAMSGEPMDNHAIVSLTAHLVVRRSTGVVKVRRPRPGMDAVRPVGSRPRTPRTLAAESS